MALNLSTFTLEIINFLVLVWILKRFLYRPVMRILSQRRDKVEQQLAESVQLHQKANDLQQQHQAQLVEWAQHKEVEHKLLQQALEAEKVRQMGLLSIELENERQKNAVLRERELKDTLQQYREQANEQGCQFVAKVFRDLASESVHQRLIELFVEHCEQMSDLQRSELLEAQRDTTDKIDISSAYPLTDAQRQQLVEQLGIVQNQLDNICYRWDSELIAGIRITFANKLLRLNLQDELALFKEWQNGQLSG